MQESTTYKVVTQIFGIIIRKENVAVTRHMEQRVLKNIGTSRVNRFWLLIHCRIDILVTKSNEIGQGRRVSIPVTATFIL